MKDYCIVQPPDRSIKYFNGRRSGAYWNIDEFERMKEGFPKHTYFRESEAPSFILNQCLHQGSDEYIP